MVMLVLVPRQETFLNKRNVLRVNPKFPTGISKRKILSHIFVFLPVPGLKPIVKPVPDSFRKLERIAQMVDTNLERNFPLGRFCFYHLLKPWTNRFPRVNGKQPHSNKAKYFYESCFTFSSRQTRKSST